ncbi:Imidazole glycerol phosphate synthase subunit HisF [Streptomyces griseorubiginosus]
MDIKVELSGGIRDDASAAALATGCTRVNLGTAALESPEWVAKVIAEHGDKIAVGLDVRGTTLKGRGWTSEGGDFYEALERLDKEGCARYVVTDIAKDGTLQGPDLELLRNVCAATDRPVVASGGVSSLDDLRAIAELVPLGVEGSIVGKALYAKAFTLEEALEAVAQSAICDASRPVCPGGDLRVLPARWNCRTAWCWSPAAPRWSTARSSRATRTADRRRSTSRSGR